MPDRVGSHKPNRRQELAAPAVSQFPVRSAYGSSTAVVPNLLQISTECAQMLRQDCQLKLEFSVSSVVQGLSVMTTRCYLLLEIMKLLLHILLQFSIKVMVSKLRMQTLRKSQELANVSFVLIYRK